MTDHIATIRKALDFVANWLGMKFTPHHIEATSALNALTAELQRLRDDPNRLDLESVPEGWSIEAFRKEKNGEWYIALSKEDDGNVGLISCGLLGPTPRAALAAAIERIGK